MNDAHLDHANSEVDSMSISAVSSSPPPYQAPATPPPAKSNDEQTESTSVKATEAAQTGQATTSSVVDVYA